MSTNARWIIGLLLALVIGLGLALAIVAGDESSDDGGSPTLPTVTEQTQETQDTETQAPPTTTSPPPTDGAGGIAAPGE